MVSTKALDLAKVGTEASDDQWISIAWLKRLIQPQRSSGARVLG